MKNDKPPSDPIVFLVTTVGVLRQEIEELHDENNRLHKENKAFQAALEVALEGAARRARDKNAAC